VALETICRANAVVAIVFGAHFANLAMIANLVAAHTHVVVIGSGNASGQAKHH